MIDGSNSALALRHWAKSMLTLLALSVPATGHAGAYCIRGEGQGQRFCEEIRAMLNKTKPTLNKLPCISELVYKMPGVSDPPWKKLDLLQHEGLARDVMLINSVGISQFFAEQKSTVPGYWPKPEQIERYVPFLKEHKGELFALNSPLVPDRLFVTVRYPNDLCGSRPRPPQPRGEDVSSAWATPDLKELVRDGPYPIGRRPLLYRGQLYFAFMNPDTGLELSRLHFTGAAFMPVCRIDFDSSQTDNCKGQPK